MFDALAPDRPLGRIARRIVRETPAGLLLRAARRLNFERLMWYGQASYSAEGEDVLLNRIFYWQQRGLYVDVGAYHPVAISNTYLFYRRGWRGITIEPSPGMKRLFRRARPRDVHLSVAVGTGGGEIALNLFRDGVYNRLDRVSDRAASGEAPLTVVHVPVLSLAEILANHAREERIDFFSIDIEGAELDALTSNDWTRYRPRVICAELLDASIDEIARHPVAEYLSAQGYRFFAKTGFSSFFAEREMRLYSDADHPK